jgi:hypothetical protein
MCYFSKNLSNTSYFVTLFLAHEDVVVEFAIFDIVIFQKKKYSSMICTVDKTGAGGACRSAYKIRLALEGIPPHAWERSTVEHLLGISCTVAEIAPETASREDLGMFRVAAWTAEKEAIPPMRELWIPEPEDFEEETAQPRPISRNQELGLLKYRVLIHLTRVEEFIRVGPSSPRSDRSGLPDSGSFGGDEGYWSTPLADLQGMLCHGIPCVLAVQAHSPYVLITG